MYLHYFESIVHDVIQDLGGPADWALPFWDYSEDPARSATLALPPAFVATTWPDGGPNPLREEERAAGIRDGDPMDVEDVRLGTWTISFSTDVLARPSFGGPVTGFHHPPAGAGIVETQPHGTVHVDVGGFNPAGLMSRFHTAPLDPIFWLHHCNIDRLWAQWQHDHPEEAYLPPSGTPGVVAGHALDDPMPPWAGEPMPPTPRSVLDHHALGYQYDDEPQPRSAGT
jgi:tyrosinase